MFTYLYLISFFAIDLFLSWLECKRKTRRNRKSNQFILLSFPYSHRISLALYADLTHIASSFRVLRLLQPTKKIRLINPRPEGYGIRFVVRSFVLATEAAAMTLPQ